jgi:putative peptide modification system cyclase
VGGILHNRLALRPQKAPDVNTDELHSQNEPSGDRRGTLLRALVLCDLADSTALVERLGDQAAAELMRRHDRMARLAMQRHGGREIDKTDGFLVLFERPIDAVAFALDYQRELRALAVETAQPMAARVGIHVGDVMVWDNAPADVAQGAKPMEVEGLAKPVAARLMGMARPGQILLSGVAQTLAQRAEAELRMHAPTARWASHGQYHLKGLPDPLAVFEVGEDGIAPMRAPPNSPKAWRAKPWWRRPVSLAVAAATLLATATVPLYVSMRSEPVLAFNERDWVVIGDLVNVNADKSLDAALGTAFRIGMEESRFINVVPDLEVRQALARMQRDGATRVDREVGSEIAMREQARALIVPSVAQFGQKLRLSVELIDPRNARTVSIQTADADDPTDALPAVDKLLRGMRTGLGESLRRIESTSQPLDKVTTSNLEALQALSRALQVVREGDFEQSGSLLVHATELDPNFATAYARLGSVLYSQQRYAEARAALEKALSIDGRLTERERLYVRALLARFVDAKTMLDLWRMYANLYPDQGTGQHNTGNVYYMFLQDYNSAEAAFVKAAATRSPLRNFSMHTLGRVLIAQEKFGQAEQQFRTAQSLSPAAPLFGLSDALVASGKYDEAARYLDEAPRQPPLDEVERGMRRATLFVARGQIDAAAAAIADVLPEASRLPAPNARWRAQAATIALLVQQGNTTAARELASRQLGEIASVAAQPDANLDAMEELLYAADWAARLDLVKDARGALALAERLGTLDRFPVRARLAALTRSEVELHTGHADVVAARLQNAGNGNDLWEQHELRGRALRTLGDAGGELAELRWLTTHRGLAYAQWTDQLLGQQARVLALRDAELRLSTYEARPAAGKRGSAQ